MARSAKKAEIDSARTAVEHALDLLRQDPPRLKRLLRETAGLADEFSAVLADADEEDLAKRVGRVAKMLRGGALLPAGMSIALLRKGLEKLVAAAG